MKGLHKAVTHNILYLHKLINKAQNATDIVHLRVLDFWIKWNSGNPNSQTHEVESERKKKWIADVVGEKNRTALRGSQGHHF